MATSVKQARANQGKKFDEPFNENELNYIKGLETFIDDIIDKDFEGSERASFDSDYIELDRSIPTNGFTNMFAKIPHYRREKISKHVIAKYKSIGWETEIDEDDGYGHPYSDFVLKPKK